MRHASSGSLHSSSVATLSSSSVEMTDAVGSPVGSEFEALGTPEFAANIPNFGYILEAQIATMWSLRHGNKNRPA